MEFMPASAMQPMRLHEDTRHVVWRQTPGLGGYG